MTYGRFPHTLNLFQKPALGNSFIRRFQVYNYRHTIAAVGGFDTASCDIAIRSRDEGVDFLNQYLGNRVAFYVDNPVAPIWEGFINRMTFSAGGVQYSISLDEMANRMVVHYVNNALDATNPQISSVSNNTDSQAIYGIKGEDIDAGFQRNTTYAPLLATASIAARPWPQTSIIPSSGGGGMLHIEFLGFYHTLEWEIFNDTNTGSITIRNEITTILLPGMANGTTFFDNTDFTDIAVNGNSITRNKIRGQTMWEIMLEFAEAGTGSNYYILGVTPTLFSSGLRRLYYQALNTTIVYTARQADGLRIRNLYGQLVPPWTVQPDRGVRVSDMLIGWNGLGDNPTETYIRTIDYDANRQSVIYSGNDDISAEGAFQFRRYSKSNGKRFGAPKRAV